jgi:CRISPR-associated endonuclease Cas3-HD
MFLPNEPLAYLGENSKETLIEHSIGVACFAKKMISQRIKALSYKKTLGIDPIKLLLLSSALHDVGKASEYYYKPLRNGIQSEISFGGHHIVSGIILYKASQYASNNEHRNLLRLATKIVVSHHQAFKLNIHKDSDKLIGRVEGICKELRVDWIKKLLDETLKRMYLDSETVKILLQTLQNPDRGGICKAIYSNVDYINRLNLNGIELKLFRTITGAIIISDYIVASINRKEKSLLAQLFMNELKLSDEVLRKMLSDCIAETY